MYTKRKLQHFKLTFNTFFFCHFFNNFLLCSLNSGPGVLIHNVLWRVVHFVQITTCPDQIPATTWFRLPLDDMFPSRRPPRVTTSQAPLHQTRVTNNPLTPHPQNPAQDESQTIWICHKHPWKEEKSRKPD